MYCKEINGGSMHRRERMHRRKGTADRGRCAKEAGQMLNSNASSAVHFFHHELLSATSSYSIVPLKWIEHGFGYETPRYPIFYLLKGDYNPKPYILST